MGNAQFLPFLIQASPSPWRPSAPQHSSADEACAGPTVRSKCMSPAQERTRLLLLEQLGLYNSWSVRCRRKRCSTTTCSGASTGSAGTAISTASSESSTDFSFADVISHSYQCNHCVWSSSPAHFRWPAENHTEPHKHSETNTDQPKTIQNYTTNLEIQPPANSPGPGKRCKRH